MKKLFGMALLSVFVLAACGGGSDNSSDDRTVVCTIEESGIEAIVTAEVEGGQVVEVTFEMLGQSIVFTEDEMDAEGLDRNVDGFIREMEADGGECSY